MRSPRGLRAALAVAVALVLFPSLAAGLPHGTSPVRGPVSPPQPAGPLAYSASPPMRSVVPDPILALHGAPSTVSTVAPGGPSGSPPQAGLLSAAMERTPGSVAPATPAIGVPEYEEQTLVLANETVLPGDYLPPRISEPYGLAVDSPDGRLFVTNYNSSDVAVLSLENESLLAVVPVGSQPTAAVYDPANDQVYVLSQGTDAVTAIGGASAHAVATVAVGGQAGSFGYPALLALDLASQQLFVANVANATISVISTVNDTVLTTIPTDVSPVALALDPANGEVYVAEESYYLLPKCSFLAAINGSSDTVVAQIPVGEFPDALAVDNVTDTVYVANLGTNNVSVVNGTTDAVTATVPVGVLPDAIAYVSVSNQVFVVNGNYEDYGTGSVSIVSASNNTVLTTVKVGYVPANILADPAADRVFVPITGGSVVVAFNASNDSILARVPVDSNPFGMAVVDGAGDVMVADLGLDGGTASLRLITASSDRPSPPLPQARWPGFMLDDPLNGRIYVSTSGTSTLEVFNASTDGLLTSIPIPSGVGPLAFDPSTNEVFVSGSYETNVTIVNATTDTVVGTVDVGLSPASLAVDVATGDLYVLDEASENVTVVSLSTDRTVANLSTGWDSVGILADPDNGMIYVLNEGYEPICISGYGCIYLNGSVMAIDGATRTMGSSVTLPGLEYGFALDRANGDLYVGGLSDDAVWVVATSTEQQVASVGVGDEPASVAVDPMDDEVFVANYNSSNVSVLSGATNTLLGTVSTGANPRWMAVDAADARAYVVNTGSENLTIINTTTFQTITVPIGVNPAIPIVAAPTGSAWISNYGSGTISIVSQIRFPTVYPVTFSFTGLPAGARWSVMVGARQEVGVGPAWSTYFTNGTYPYLVEAPAGYHLTGAAPAGSVSVDAGPVALSYAIVSGAPPALTFREAATLYAPVLCVTIAGELTECDLLSTRVTFQNLSVGVYPYAVHVPAGFEAIVTVSGHALSTLGNLTLGSGGLKATVTYHPVYAVYFLETGLASGTVWSVTVAKQTYSSNSTSLVVYLTSGRHGFRVGVPSGYRARPASGSANVRTGFLTVPIQFVVRTK